MRRLIDSPKRRTKYIHARLYQGDSSSLSIQQVSIESSHPPNQARNQTRKNRLYLPPGLGIGIRLLMLTDNTHIAVIDAGNLRLEQRQPTANMDEFTGQPRLRAMRHGTQIRHVEMARHPAERELARLADGQEDGGGEDVDHGRGAAAVDVAYEVAHLGGDVEEERHLRAGAARGGLEAEITGVAVDVPVLVDGLLC